MIEFRHVYKTYPGPVHALKNVEFSIGKGEFVFLTGPSGAGKTTLFRMLSAFDRPTSGKVQVGDFDLDRLDAQSLPHFRRKIGIVFQDFRLLRDRSVFENVSLPLRVKEERAHLIARKVDEALAWVGLTSKAEFSPAVLSGGEQQRVAIARALVHQPGLLIADEPTGNLDPDMSEGIMDLMERVCAQGTTVFVATHDHAMVERRKKRTIQIKEGAVVGDSSVGGEAATGMI
ncbi:MAG: cell division ATP-binding protein FtsE [Bdellovibrio sp.]|nr:MAG: cell division ATP-binding protein FtsE [Bdellovibrio sp.]